MDIRNWYEERMENKIEHLEKKYAILTLVALFGVMAGIDKEKRGFKVAFILADLLLIFVIAAELVYSINKIER